ncbi:MAG: LamG domain-containing protein, partial [Terrimicrobiaceae bacterium]|nr:LamG domain-containing protein [Terrimicrobiaceae bacterium]
PNTRVGDDVYVAAKVSVNAQSGAKIELLARNLTRLGELLRASEEKPGLTSLFEGGAPLSIGGVGIETGGQQNWRGRIDEVRISRGWLPEDRLLISP